MPLRHCHAPSDHSSLSPAPPYRDHVAWLRRQDPDEARAFWRERLAGVEAAIPLGWRTPREAWSSPGASGHPLDGYADAHRQAERAMKQSRALAAALAGAPVLDEPARELLADVEAAVNSDPISWRDVTPAPLQGVRWPKGRQAHLPSVIAL